MYIYMQFYSINTVFPSVKVYLLLTQRCQQLLETQYIFGSTWTCKTV